MCKKHVIYSTSTHDPDYIQLRLSDDISTYHMACFTAAVDEPCQLATDSLLYQINHWAIAGLRYLGTLLHTEIAIIRAVIGITSESSTKLF